MTDQPSNGITPDEKKALEISAELWNAIAALGEHHPSDMEEHQRDVHDIQHRIMARVARRLNPEFFR